MTTVYIGIDPDVEKSGFAVLDRTAQSLTFCGSLSFYETLLHLRMIAQQYAQDRSRVLVVIEDSDISVNWHYNPHDKPGVIAAKGRSVGMCHATIRHLREICENIGLTVRMQPPLRKVWHGPDGKITHEEASYFMKGLPKRTNQEARDAALLCYDVSGLPIRVKRI